MTSIASLESRCALEQVGLFMAVVDQQVDATSFSKERTTVSSQKLRNFSSIELLPKTRNLPGESFSIQRLFK